MAKVLDRGNYSTEKLVAAALMRARLRGWKCQGTELFGRPDFVFESKRIAIFVDGCFWHGCRKCNRNIPRTNRVFWVSKIATNKARDRKVVRTLKAQGYAVVRLWEHEVSGEKWLSTLKALMATSQRNS